MKRLLFVLLFCSSSAFAQAASNLVCWDYLATDVTANAVTGFSLERKIESAVDQCAVVSPIIFTQIVVAAPTLRCFTDAGLTMGTTYCYRAFAVNAASKSVSSNVVGRTIPLVAPPAPLMKPVVGGP